MRKKTRLFQKAKIYKGLQGTKYQEKLRNARLCNNHKSVIHLPRHSSFMIMHIFADWGNTGQNMAESIGVTTVSTIKAHGQKWDKDKGVGRNP